MLDIVMALICFIMEVFVFMVLIIPLLENAVWITALY